MARHLEWRELKTGTIAFAVLVSLVFGILLFARVGTMRGDKGSIYVLAPDAGGILPGTEVWLSGLKIGLVKDVHYRPITTDTLQRLAIHTEILADKMNYIRRDAFADIRPGGNLIGTPIVFISSGTSRAPALKSGDTLRLTHGSAMSTVGNRVGPLTDRLTALADTGQRVIALINSQVGTLGALNAGGLAKLGNATSALTTLLGKATRGDGALGLAARGDLGRQIARINAGKDSILRMAASGTGNVGLLRKDSALYKQVDHVRSEIDSLKSLYSAGAGIGRMKGDTAFTAEMARVRAQLSDLMADIKKHPTRYISF